MNGSFTGFFHPEISGVITTPTYNWFLGPTLCKKFDLMIMKKFGLERRFVAKSSQCAELGEKEMACA